MQDLTLKFNEGHTWKNDAEWILTGYIWDESEQLPDED